MTASSFPNGAHFTINRDRDAWATIRGFVYQVELTIQRWILLSDGEVLEPERGEDIDTVRTVLCNESDPHRILEQVKHRAKNITIRSGETLAALSDFYEHHASNADLKLQFRFITNASVGRERPALFPKKQRGLDRWNALRTSDGSTGDDQSAVTAILKLLRGSGRPEGYPKEEWNQFQTFLTAATTDDFLRFLRTVEFSCGTANAKDLRSEIVELLMDEGLCDDAAMAREAYRHLFISVFSLLATPPPRRLTRDQLRSAIEEHRHPEDVLAEKAFDGLQKLRLDVDDLKQRLEPLRNEVNLLTVQASEISATIRFSASEQEEIPPPAPEPVIPRVAAIELLVSSLARWPAVYLHGAPGSGKSQLARIASLRLTAKPLWLRTRGLPDELAAHLLVRARQRLKSRAPDLLVVDDVPRVTLGSSTGPALVALLNEARELLPVLLTSEFHLPNISMMGLTAHAVHEIECPPFSDDDIKTLLAAYGAPATFASDEWIAVLAQATRRHATLAVAAALHLRARSWSSDTAAINDLFAGSYTSAVATDATVRLFQTVPDQTTRELLHRLRLAMSSFPREAVSAIAKVSPSIGEPLLRLTTVDGVWLLRETKDEWLASPLLQVIPDPGLPELTVRECHLAFARQLLSGPVPPAHIRTGLLHLFRARAYSAYADVLQRALSETLHSDESTVGRLLHDILALFPVPSALPPARRVQIVALQFAAMEEGHIHHAQKMAELERIVFGDDKDVQDIAPAVALMVIRSATGVFAVRLARKAATGWRHDALKNVPWAAIIELASGDTDTNEAGIEWAEMVVDLPGAVREQLLADSHWPSFAMSVCNRMYLRKHASATATWDTTLDALDRVRHLGATGRIEVLEAAAASLQILILGEDLRELADAAAVVSSTLSRVRQPVARFFVLSAWLQVLNIHEQWVLAAQQAQIAFQRPAEGIDAEAIWTGVRGAYAAAQLGDARGAAALSEKAAAAALRDGSIMATFRAQAVLEHGLALWLAGDTLNAAKALIAGGRLAADAPVQDRKWKNLMMRLAHVLSVVSPKMRLDDIRPGHAHDSGSSLPLGFFLLQDEKPADGYEPGRPLFVLGALSNLAHCVGDVDLAGDLASRALDRSYDSGTKLSEAAFICLVPYLLREQAIEDVIESAFSVGLAAGGPENEYLTGDPWQPGDRSLLLFGLVPSVFCVATRIATDRSSGLALLERMLGSLQEVAENSESGGAWKHVISMFEQCAGLSGARRDGLRSASASRDWGGALVHRCCLILSSVDEDVSPAELAFCQASSLPELVAVGGTVTRDVLVLPYAETVWHAAITQHGYQFVAPMRVRRDLADTREIHNPRERLSAILSTVWPASGAPISAQAQNWLRNLGGRRPAARGGPSDS